MAKKRHRYKFSRILVFGLIGASSYLFLNLVSYRSEMARAMEEQHALAEKQATLERSLAYNENKLEFIGTDEYIEQEARSRLGWVRENEILYVDSADRDRPQEKERATATPTPTPPGPAPTARPSVPVPGQSTPTPRPTSTPRATESAEPPEAAAASSPRTLPPEPSATSTPKDIG